MDELNEIVKLIKDISNANKRLEILCKKTKNKNNKIFFCLDDADANLGYTYEYLFESLIKLCNNDYNKAYSLLKNE